MQYTDKLSKGFLTGKGTFITNQSSPGQIGATRWDVEDPTYLGFYWHIIPETVTDPLNYDLDYLPQGLFLGANNNSVANASVVGDPNNKNYGKEHPDSAVSYLQRIGEYYRADMIKEFRYGMIKILEESPWSFDKITGLGEMTKINPKDNFRAKDKKLIFEGNDTMNMRLTYLMDLYRKAAFDAEYMRWMLPETQRYFSMRVVVAEIRTMNDGHGGLFEPATFLEFVFDYCEFTIIEDGLDHIQDLNNYPGESARVKIGIKVGRIREKNSYGLLGAILFDTIYPYYRDASFSTSAFTSITQPAGRGDKVTQAFSAMPAYRSPGGNADFTYGDDKRRQTEQAFQSANGVVKTGGMNGILGAFSNAVSRDVKNLVQTAVNGAVLGNVYGLSIANLSAQISSIAQDPLSAAQSTISKYGTSSSRGPLENVFVDQATTAGLQTFASQLASAQAEYSLAIKASKASQDISGNLGKESIGNAANIIGNPGKESLTSAFIPNSNPGKEQLGNAANPEGNPGKAFNNPLASSGLNNALDKILLGGATSSLSGNLGKELLSSVPSSSIAPGNVSLDGEKTNILGNPGKTNLIAPNAEQVNLGKEYLATNGANTEGQPGNVKLTGENSNTDGNPGSLSLDGANRTQQKLGKEPLIAPNIDKTNLGNINLK